MPDKSRGLYIFFYGKEAKIMNWNRIFFLHHRIVSAVKKVGFVSDRISYIVLKGRWYNIILVNLHAQAKRKVKSYNTDFMKN
jgi:hypothetical protein